MVLHLKICKCSIIIFKIKYFLRKEIFWLSPYLNEDVDLCWWQPVLTEPNGRRGHSTTKG